MFNESTESTALVNLATDLAEPRAVKFHQVAADHYRATGQDAVVVQKVVGIRPHIVDGRLAVDVDGGVLNRALRLLIVAGHRPALLRLPQVAFPAFAQEGGAA